jgi:hypothetical protein
LVSRLKIPDFSRFTAHAAWGDDAICACAVVLKTYRGHGGGAVVSKSRILAAFALVGVLAQPDPAAADQRLVQAAARGDLSAVRLLLRERVDVNAADADGSTALHYGVWADDLATVDELIKRVHTSAPRTPSASRQSISLPNRAMRPSRRGC